MPPRKAHQIDPEDVRFLSVEPLIPLRGITIVAGKGGVNKTTFACWYCAQISREGVEVAYLTREDDVPSSLRPKVEAAGADLERVTLIDASKGEHRMTFRADGDDAATLATLIKDGGFRLVILDPLTAFVPSINTMAGVRAALEPGQACLA
jgi:Mrp family chromosome partitioning ATPase